MERNTTGNAVRRDLAVVGLGYVGLPVARAACAAGMRVAGYDIDAVVVDRLASGRSHVGDVSDEDVRVMLTGCFLPTTDAAVLERADVILICVPTPIGTRGEPDLSAVLEAARTVAAHLRRGTLVVLESTTYPGTTTDVVRPILEEMSGLTASADFHLAFSPERIDPGNRLHDLVKTPKVVGGVTPADGEVAAAFYSRLVERVVRAKSSREAEMAKLIENTYRFVNIALVNELAVFCHEFGIDVWDAIACAATKPFGFHAFQPGPGVGGHCIPVDPQYLAHEFRALGRPLWFVEVAREVNARMPRYVVERAAALLNAEGRAINGARVLLLGVTYKRDVSDTRESPASGIAELLLRGGAHVTYHDPLASGWEVMGQRVTPVPDLAGAMAGADLTILLQDHSVYDPEMLARHARMLLDTRGMLRGQARPTVEQL